MLKKSPVFLLLQIILLIFASNLYAVPITGNSSGSFINPRGYSTMVISGVNTNNFTWGEAITTEISPSKLTFTGSPFSIETGTVFSFGSLYFYNGQVVYSTEASDIDLFVALSFSSPYGGNAYQDVTYDLKIKNTLNTGNPDKNADFIDFPDAYPDIYFTLGNMAYTIELLGFGIISESGYTVLDWFSVLESSETSAQLLGMVTATTPEPVPEPATMLLLGVGLANLMVLKKKYKRS